MIEPPALEELFPKLAAGTYRITSQPDPNYNCFGYAIGDQDRWWEPSFRPDAHWPDWADHRGALKAWFSVLEGLGFERCRKRTPEDGFDKVALYLRRGAPQHIARQLPSGRWSSKIGGREDIEHDLDDLAGDVYGTPMVFMRRRAERPV